MKVIGMLYCHAAAAARRTTAPRYARPGRAPEPERFLPAKLQQDFLRGGPGAPGD